MNKGLSYAEAGVDIDAGEALVQRIKPLARQTLRPEVLAGIGGFGSLFAVPKHYRNPILVSGTDGVGTKLKLAFQFNQHDTIGIDLVAMSVNDIVVQGAEPLFFLDYFACGKLDVATAEAVISGIATGCALAGCALVGGETAEMPGMYPAGEYDLAGFAVGCVEQDAIIDGRHIAVGDVVLGLASSGAHANGYSLIRKILAQSKVDMTQNFDGKTWQEILLAPTRIYAPALLMLSKTLTIKGMAHITGGGVLDNIPRILPQGMGVELRRWVMPALFTWLQEAGKLADSEMYRTFNCGIGMVVVVAEADADKACAVLREAGETVLPLGMVCAATSKAQVVIV